MKLPVFLAMILCATGAFGQAISNVPQTVLAAFISPTGAAGSWFPALGSGTGTTIPNVPTPAAMYCSNNGTGNAGTWVPCSAGSFTAPDMVAYFGQLNVSTLNAGTSVPLTPAAPITITRVEWGLPTEGTTCTTTPIVSITVGGIAQTLTIPMTTVTSKFQDHVDGTQAIVANGVIALKTTTAASCSVQPGNPFMVVHYTMQ